METSILTSLGRLPAFQELIVNFTLREIKAKYKQAFFGIAWAIIQPIVLLGMMTLVFGYFAKIPSDGVPYPLFLFPALLPWQFFANAVTRGTGSLVNQAALITKIYFPREVLVLASLAAALVDFAITAMVLIGLLVYYHVAPGAAWLWIAPVLLIQTMLALALMLFVAPLNAMYRDVGQAIPLAIQVWMYATPIMYPASLVPESVRSYYFLNPMAVIVESYRSAMLQNRTPDLAMLAYAAVVAMVLLWWGYRVFKRLETRIADVA